jgi:hypothetical protein
MFVRSATSRVGRGFLVAGSRKEFGQRVAVTGTP